MVKLLDPTDIDPITEQVDEMMDEAAVDQARKMFAYTPTEVGDLSDGGMVGQVKVRPNRDKNITTGRPTARGGWTWNGSVTTLPLAWNPEGTRHDGARHYLLKRHCLCCHSGGFFGKRCPQCAKNNCERCKGSTDTITTHTLQNGNKVQGWIIPCNYLRKEDVPYPARFYGSIDCFLEFCPRRGSKGFLTEQDMRVHAQSRHRLEYQAHLQTLAASREDQVTVLQRRVDELLSREARQNTVVQEVPPRRKQRTSKKLKAAVGVAS